MGSYRELGVMGSYGELDVIYREMRGLMRWRAGCDHSWMG